MLDSKDFLNIVKKASVEAVEEEKPVKIIFGKVMSVSPLKINVEQKMILGSEQLILTRTVSSSLENGDKVIILRMQGGQKFIILDKY